MTTTIIWMGISFMLGIIVGNDKIRKYTIDQVNSLIAENSCQKCGKKIQKKYKYCYTCKKLIDKHASSKS